MRVLFTAYPAYGHVQPMLPLTRAMAGSGHEVQFATSASFADTVRRHGFGVAPTGLDEPAAKAELYRRVPDVQHIPIADRRLVVFTTLFAVMPPRRCWPTYCP